jgi:hypothetical protein
MAKKWREEAQSASPAGDHPRENPATWMWMWLWWWLWPMFLGSGNVGNW